MSNGGERPTVFLIAGDVSGDRQGAALAHAIRALAPEVRLCGAGGAGLRAAGVDVCADITPTSVLGALEAVRRLGALHGRYRAVRRAIRATRPHLAVLVDTEALLLPIGLWLRRAGVPLILYFPPQVWMWGRWRLYWVRLTARRVVSAFAPEAALYRAAGVDTLWAGHPLRDLVRAVPDAAGAVRAAGLDPQRPIVALMPGSRQREFDAVMPVVLDAARQLQQRDARLQFALPLASERYRAVVEAAVRARGLRDVAVYRPDSYAVLSQARVVVQCAGTATLETALLGLPSVIVYRCRAIEYLVTHHLYQRVPFIGLPNILLGEMVQPEFFYRDADAPHLAAAAWELLTDERRSAAVRNRLAAVRDLLGPPGASERAARAIVELLPVDGRAGAARLARGGGLQ
jgi:lipid-A-disaccharide synthase